MSRVRLLTSIPVSPDQELLYPTAQKSWAFTAVLSLTTGRLAPRVPEAQYLIPDLLGETQEEIEMWQGCSRSEIQYLEYVPDEFLNLWDQSEAAVGSRAV